MMAYYGDQGNENYGGKWEPRRSSGGGMSDLPYWILALVFLFAFPPVGVLMIALRLFGGGKRRVAGGAIPIICSGMGRPPWGPGPLSVSRHGARKRPAGGRKSARKGKRNRICPRCAWT